MVFPRYSSLPNTKYILSRTTLLHYPLQTVHITVHLFAIILVFIVNILLASITLFAPTLESSLVAVPGRLLSAPGCLLANSGPNSRFGFFFVPFRKKPRFLALVVLAKALLSDIEAFLTWPEGLVEDGAGGCQPVMAYPLGLVGFGVGIRSDS